MSASAMLTLLNAITRHQSLKGYVHLMRRPWNKGSTDGVHHLGLDTMSILCMLALQPALGGVILRAMVSWCNCTVKVNNLSSTWRIELTSCRVSQASSGVARRSGRGHAATGFEASDLLSCQPPPARALATMCCCDAATQCECGLAIKPPVPHYNTMQRKLGSTRTVLTNH